MARALCVEPDLLLLDEPLSALDPKGREDVQEKLVNIKRSLKLTTVHVTHDFEEAIALGDRICVIGEGEVKQTGSPEEIFRRPDSEFVARFAMARNIFTGVTVVSKEGEGCQFRTDGVTFSAMEGVKEANRAVVRPEEVVVSVNPLEEGKMENVFSGRISGISDKGATLLITVDLPPLISILITRREFMYLNPVMGMMAYVGFPASAVHLFHENTL
jgi:ABC-type Fe3+/spermidine/putrescine transport system ATPase subunit